MKYPGDPRYDYARWMRRIGAGLLILAIWCGYGLYRGMASKLLVRGQGERTAGHIIRYETYAGHQFPVVRFRAMDAHLYEVRATESFLLYTAPPVSTPVDVYYDTLPPDSIEIRVHSGLAQYEWLLTPALLASLFVILLLSGLRFLLILPGDALDSSSG